jgi:tetratricopeptide (TPR) repeat protein
MYILILSPKNPISMEITYFCDPILRINIIKMKRPVFYFLISIALILTSCAQPSGNKDKSESADSTKSTSSSTIKVQPARKNQQGDSVIIRGTNVASLFTQGANLLKEQKWEEGISFFDKVIDKDPKNSKAYYNRGFGYYGLKDYDKAWNDFDKATQLDPKDSTAFLYMGLIKYYEKDYEASITQYNNAIKAQPKYATAFYNRGISKGQLKDYAGAEKDFDIAIQYKPDYADAYFNRGLAKYFQKEQDKACEDWQKAKELGSFSADQAIKTYCQGSK